MFKNFKFLRNIIGLFCVGWLIFSHKTAYQYSNVEQNYLLNENSKIILVNRLENPSDSESDIESEGIVESDIEEDTQFLLRKMSSRSPEVMPIGGFINLQNYAYSRDIKTLETPSQPIFVEPKINPDWFRPEINPQFTTLKDRKLQQQRSLSLRAERKINQRRRQQRKPYYGVAVKRGKEFYHPYAQLRDKFHHAPCLGVPIPRTLANEINDLALNVNYDRRIKTFRNQQKLPSEYVEISAIRLREHVIDPDTQVIKGTFGKRQEIRRKRLMKRDSTKKALPHRKGFILYNPKTNLLSFYEEKTHILVTYFMPTTNQIKDIKSNKNIL